MTIDYFGANLSLEFSVLCKKNHRGFRVLEGELFACVHEISLNGL